MDYKTVLTVCPYCGCGCGMYLEVMDGKVTGTLPSMNHPISEGSLCIKGWNAHEPVHSPKRLTKPLVKKDGKLTEASWDEAIGKVASELTRIRDQHGPNSVAVLTSAKCTNEENYLMMKLTRAVIGTNNIDHCARL
jgi:predicted molibdopterin-dependent oxidoreductase YjgC